MKNFIDWLTTKLNVEDDGHHEWMVQDTVYYVKHIQDMLTSQESKPWDGKHYGDCIEENTVCYLCLYLSWLKGYEDYCRINYILKEKL